MNGEENLRLLEQIDAHRRFILQSCLDNPVLLARAEPRIRWMLGVETPFPDLKREADPASNHAPRRSS